LADLSLSGASVGGAVQMQGAVLAGRVNLSEARIGDLTLWRDRGTNPVWRPGSSLVLRNLQAASLQAQMPESWQREDGTALPVDLQGFRYDRLGGLGAGAAGDLGRVGDVTALIGWVEAATDSTGPSARHAPQPYFQLESVLRDMGAARSADRVAYARHLDRLGNYGPGLRDRIAWTGEQIWRFMVGFGVYPFRLLWWIGGLMLAGTVVASLTQPLRVAGWRDYRRLLDCFWYSVENTLPLVERSGDNRGIVHDHWATRSAFHFQKIAGFVLATILVGALTLVGS
jgi:hypothetical protein